MNKKWIWLSLVLLLILGLGVWTYNVASHAFNLMQTRQELKGLVQNGFDSVSPPYAFQLLHEANSDLDVLDRNLKIFYPITGLFKGMPGQVQPAIQYLNALVDYALLFEEKIAPVYTDGINNQVDVLQLLNNLFSDREFIRQVLVLSSEVTVNREALDISALPFRFQDDFQMLERFLPMIQLSGEVLPYFPELIGMDAPAEYLLLALNNDELRGGGGFITAMGTLTVQNLANIDFDLRDSYQFDDLSKDFPIPPEPLVRFWLAGYWLARDGNWSADFPTSAQKVQELYRISNELDAQGVIAFDQEAVRQVMAALGPIQVDPLAGVWVDQGNIIQYMRESWASNAEDSAWWANRKDFITIVGRAILDTILKNKDLDMVIQLAKTGQSLLRSGHVMLYLNNPTLQSMLRRQGLDHSVTAPAGDFLYWVDSNIGFNKVDAVIQRSLSYEVDLRDLASPAASLVMQFNHPVTAELPCEHIADYGQNIAYSNMFQRCYWDYWRVYRPAGSTVSSAAFENVPREQLLSDYPWRGPLDDVSDLPGLSMSGGLLVQPTNSTREIAIAYLLPQEILTQQNGELQYRLTILKQLGLRQLPVKFRIQIPPGAQFMEVPGNMLISGNDGNLEMMLTESSNTILITFTP